jgi:hypothetical protein
MCSYLINHNHWIDRLYEVGLCQGLLSSSMFHSILLEEATE